MDLNQIKSLIRNVPNFPKAGIQFKDITTILQNPIAFNYVVDSFFDYYKKMNPDVIVGIESRGFIFGAPLAIKLNCSFVLARKPGKLPSNTITQEYDLEYGTDALQLHSDSIKNNDNVVIIDDLLATGGTATACGELVKKLSGIEPNFGFFIDLGISEKSFVNCFSLVKF